MVRVRKQIFLGIGLVMVMGLAMYLRLWTIDYHFSSSETELLRYSLFFLAYFYLKEIMSLYQENKLEIDFHFVGVLGKLGIVQETERTSLGVLINLNF